MLVSGRPKKKSSKRFFEQKNNGPNLFWLVKPTPRVFFWVDSRVFFYRANHITSFFPSVSWKNPASLRNGDAKSQPFSSPKWELKIMIQNPPTKKKIGFSPLKNGGGKKKILSFLKCNFGLFSEAKICQFHGMYL